MELSCGVDLPIWSILLSVTVCLSYIYLTRTFRTWTKQGIRGPRPLPIFGTFHQAMMAGNAPAIDETIVQKYGKIAGEYRGSIPVLAVADPEFLRLSLVKEFNNMPNRLELNTGTMVDCFMTILCDDHWRHVRASLSPTFTSGKLKQLKKRVDDSAEQFVKYIGETKGEPFLLKKFCGGFTMDTICSTAFGIQLDSQKDLNHPMLEYGNRMMGTVGKGFWNKVRFAVRMAVLLCAPRWFQRGLVILGFRLFDYEAIDYFEGVTSKIISERGSEGTKEKDFVQLCVNQLTDDPKLSDPETQVDRFGKAWTTKGLTKEEIIANAALFFLAGYDTTATTLQYILFELALNPDVQDRIHAEAVENTSSDVATYEELSKMEYLDWVIHEAMRLYPVAPRVDRLVNTDTTIEGIHLPAGSMVSAMIYVIHHDPEIWPDPYKFDPERHAPENCEDRHQYAWIPFGIGNRNCIGMRLALLEMKIAIVKILNNFVLEPCSETPSKPLKYARNFRMDPETPIKLTVRRRKTMAAE